MEIQIAELIKNRRTIHRFQADLVPAPEVIKAAIEHAVWAPNHYLTEPWRFYLLGEETKAKICALNAELVRAKQGESAAEAKLKRWREMPGWLVLTCARSEEELRQEEDYAACCCAAQNLLLYLWKEGIGVKWTTGNVVRHPELYKIMGLDTEQEKIVGLYWYGKAAIVPPARRRPVDDILSELP